MKLRAISEDFAVGRDLAVYPNRPRSVKLHYYELPLPVQHSISSIIKYEDIASIQKWLDGYFIKTKQGKEYGFNKDGTDWDKEAAAQEVTSSDTSTKRIKL